MKVIVIGSGLIGLTSAYFLKRQGHEVTVLDREAGPGRETSFANGALLTPSMSDPWNAPGCWRVLVASLARSDAPLQLRLRTLPSLAGWGIKFLKNSNPTIFERNTRTNLQLALHSLKAMESLRQETSIEYGRTALGALKVFRDLASLDRASAATQPLRAYGLSFRRLSSEETIQLEPALAPIASQLAGAIHYATDETGNAYRFCVALADIVRKMGVELCFGTNVSSLEMQSGKVTAVLSGQQRFTADRYIIAAGSYSPLILRSVGIHLPVRPAKGYSVTFDCPPGKTSLRIPVIDDALHAVVVPLEGAIRVAGTAEFAGYDLSLPQPRIQNLLSLLGEILPQVAFDPAAAKPWCGLRPMSADGVPIIGATSIANLWLNTGHGHLGWTMAAGSGQLLADLMSQNTSAVDPAPFALARFEKS
jgi:D-amino-acid dehydrogenase